MENALVALYAELQEQELAIPKRLNEDELRRFYVVANGDFAKFSSSVKDTIQWRRKYTLLSQQELKAWDNLVFWHGTDVMQRPSLVIRIGLAASTLDSNGHEEFVRAVVSQVEHGVVNLVDPEIPQLTVLLDCDRLSPFKFPLQTFRSCVELLQYHYPNRLACLLVVRVPEKAEVMTQTLYNELRPGTKPKVTFFGLDYYGPLSKYFKELPVFPPSRESEIGCCVAIFFVLFMVALVVLLCIFIK